MLRQLNQKPPKVGLILSGGGALAAYQVGVLAAIAKSMPRGSPCPFRVICGTSAGAINAGIIAANADDFRRGVLQAIRAWTALDEASVYHADIRRVSRSAGRFFRAVLGGRSTGGPIALLNNAPLRDLIQRVVNFQSIRDAIANGHLDALCVTASSYDSGQSVSFFEGIDELQPWSRVQREGVRVNLGAQHIMASAAIPLLYPAENIGGQRYGDGAVRQLLPLSPAVRLGADRIFILGVGATKEKATYEYAATHSPTISQIGGHLLDSVFMDNVDADLERMQSMNDAIRQIPAKSIRGQEQSGLKLLDSFVFSPPTALHRLVSQHAHKLPVAVRIALRSIGAIGKNRNDVLSYLLTDGAYCKALIRRGYIDGMSRRDVITRWIGQEHEDVKTGTSIRQAASRWSMRAAVPWLRRVVQ